MSNAVFSSRFKIIVDFYKSELRVNNDVFAEKLKVARSTIYKFIQGEIAPSVQLIEKLLSLRVNPEFLTHGKEPILLEEPADVLASDVFQLMNKRIALDAPALSSDGTVPFVNISAMAGYRFFVQDEKENFERIKVPHNVKSKVDYAFEIEGDSMQPIINNNAVAYCRKVDTGEEIQFFLATTRKRIYVICTENQLFVKFLVKDSEGKLFLESANDDYPRVAIDLSQIKLLFRVEGVSNVF